MLIRRVVIMVNIGLLAALENAIGHTEAHLTQLGAVIDECRSAGWRCGYHECLLLGAQDRLGRLHTRPRGSWMTLPCSGTQGKSGLRPIPFT